MKINPYLSRLCNLKNETEFEWNNLMQCVFNEMQPYFMITKDGLQNVYKGKPKSIELSTQRWGNNKHVTTITNCQLYGIDLAGFRDHLQLHFQASTTHDAASNVIKVQGNQVTKITKLLQGIVYLRTGCMESHFVLLLTDTYNIPKQYIMDTSPVKSKK